MTRITKQLNHLEAVGLIKLAKTQPELEYLFRHALVQEAAYNSLLLEDRKKLHRQVGEAIEQSYPDRLEELAPILAEHFLKAAAVEKAIHYLLLAGDQARDLYAHQEAINYYQQALELLKEQEAYDLAARTQMKLGLTFHNAFDFEQARQAYQQGFALWQKAGEVTLDTVPPAPHALRLPWPEPQVLDPGLSSWGPSNVIVTQLFSGLVTHSSEMEVLPEVAQSWEILEEGTKYIFHLREDMHWSDGTAVTAGDFEYAWKRVLDPATGSPNASLLHDIKGARDFHEGEVSDSDEVKAYASDEITLIVELEEPTSYFLHLLTQSGAFPVPRHAVKIHGETWTAVDKIVSNGPFFLETWRQGEVMVLARNRISRDRGMGNLQKVELSFHWRKVEPSTELLQSYEANSIDIVGVFPLSLNNMAQARQRHAGEYFSGPLLRTIYLGFDVSQPPFHNPQIRHAFAMALDLEEMVQKIGMDVFVPANGGLIPLGMPGHSVGLHLPFQPDQARHLLAEAGFPDAHEFPVVEGLITEGWEQLGQYLQDQWRKNLGLEIKWVLMEPTEFFNTLNKISPSLFLSGWLADYPDPDTFLRANPIRQNISWQNETYDRLVEEARRVTDQGRRMALYRQADKILVEDAAIIPLTYARLECLMKPWIKRYPVSPINWGFWKDVIIEPH